MVGRGIAVGVPTVLAGLGCRDGDTSTFFSVDFRGKGRGLFVAEQEAEALCRSSLKVESAVWNSIAASLLRRLQTAMFVGLMSMPLMLARGK